MQGHSVLLLNWTHCRCCRRWQRHRLLFHLRLLGAPHALRLLMLLLVRLLLLVRMLLRMSVSHLMQFLILLRKPAS